VDLKILGVNGVRIHKLGNGGAAAVQYQSATAALWQAALAGLAPNAAIVLLGTNDHSAEIVPSAFNTQIGAILDRIVAARALTDRMLLSPTGNGLVKTYPLSAYVTELRSLAVSKDIAMLDAYLHMPSYTNGNSRNLYANTTHLNANGGQYVADQLLRVLTAT
jgi:lysophospholipase L1-like esterase